MPDRVVPDTDNSVVAVSAIAWDIVKTSLGTMSDYPTGEKLVEFLTKQYIIAFNSIRKVEWKGDEN